MKAAFDTHSLVKGLIGEGFKEKQAEAIINVVRDARDFDLDRLATKADLSEVRSELKSDLSEVRSELKADILELRSELKADILELRSELKADISGLKFAMKTNIAESKVDLIKWFVPLLVTIIIGIIGIFGVLIKYIK